MQPNAIVYASALRDFFAFFSSTSTFNMAPTYVFSPPHVGNAQQCVGATLAHIQRMAPRLRLTCVGCAVSGVVAVYK